MVCTVEILGRLVLGAGGRYSGLRKAGVGRLRIAAIALTICCLETYQEKAVPGEGFEPTRPCGQRILSPLRLPISPTGHDRISFILRPAVRQRADRAWLGGGLRARPALPLSGLSPITRSWTRDSRPARAGPVGATVCPTTSASPQRSPREFAGECSGYSGVSTVQSWLTFRP